MALRLAVSVVLGCLIGLALLWLMQALLRIEAELGEESKPLSIDFVRLRRDTEPEEEKRKPPRKEKPDQPPPPPDISMQKTSLTQGEGIATFEPEVATGDLDGGLVGGGTDRDIVPLVRIEPDYPMNARQRGIEGWVVVEFTVTKIGSVQDPVVIAANPGRIFDRAALQAVRKWKYNPKVEGGQAVPRPGVRVRLDFYMDD
jgi:protein TonB